MKPTFVQLGQGPDQPPVTPLRPPAKTLQLLVQYDDKSAEVHPLTETITTLGRREDNNVVLSFDYISAYHAQIQRLHTGEYQLRDLASQNGTSVNGKRIRKSSLEPGDILVLGLLGVVVQESGSTGPVASSSPVASGEAGSSVNSLVQERERLQRERQEIRRSLERLQARRDEVPNESTTEPIPNRGPEVQPLSPPTPNPPVPNPAPAPAPTAEEPDKVGELQDEIASIDSRKILIRSNVERLESELEEPAAADPESDQKKAEIEDMKSDLNRKEQELETFLGRLQTTRIEAEDVDETTDEFREILNDFDELCSDLENKVQRLEGELKSREQPPEENS